MGCYEDAGGICFQDEENVVEQVGDTESSQLDRPDIRSLCRPPQSLTTRQPVQLAHLRHLSPNPLLTPALLPQQIPKIIRPNPPHNPTTLPPKKPHKNLDHQPPQKIKEFNRYFKITVIKTRC